MKKLVLFAMTIACLSIFSACEKSDELIDQSVDLQMQATEKPDVYSENGYLVFKNGEIADSVADLRAQVTYEEQLDWEQFYRFESARIFRTKLNDKIVETEDYQMFDNLVKEATNLGYFNNEEKCMDYPFANENWASILNKDGVVKIGDVLYLFTKTGGKAIVNGNLNQIKKIKHGNTLPENVTVFDFENKLKSTTLPDYGEVYHAQVNRDKKYYLDVSLNYDERREDIDVIDINTGQIVTVSFPVAVEYNFYCRARKRKFYGWFDYRTRLYHVPHSVNVGGNTVPEDQFTYGIYTYSSSNTVASESELANHHINVYGSPYPFLLIENQPAPSVSPVINSISFDFWCESVTSNNKIYVRIN